MTMRTQRPLVSATAIRSPGLSTTSFGADREGPARTATAWATRPVYRVAVAGRTLHSRPIEEIAG